MPLAASFRISAHQEAKSPICTTLPVITGVFSPNFAKREISPGTLTSSATPSTLR